MLVAIGDVHGYYREMQSLLANLRRAGCPQAIDFATDRLIWLGDYVDCGPDSALVVQTLIELAQTYPHWVFLKGNHEEELVTALVSRPRDQAQFANWHGQGGRETLASYERWAGADRGQEPDAASHAVPAAHLAWLDGRPCYTESERFAFVHAGFDPRLATFADNGPEEMLWIREAFIDSERDWGKRIIFGHTDFREPLVLPNKIGINTMHRHGGRLTAVILSDDDPAGFSFVRD
jgi:serine/threonine protein phosphatase 1